MRAEYDTRADAIEIVLDDGLRAIDHDVEVHARANVSMLDGRPVSIEIVTVAGGIDAPLASIADRYPDLDHEGLTAISRAAIAAPDRQVVMTVADPGAAA